MPSLNITAELLCAYGYVLLRQPLQTDVDNKK